MADNVTFQAANPATPPSGFRVATDDIDGVAFQRVKLDAGADGVSLPVDASNPLPVSGTVAITAAALPLPAGAATADNQTNGNQKTRLVDNSGSNLVIEDGTLTTRDYFVAVAEGDVPNHVRWDTFGYNADVDNAEEDLISQGGLYVFPATAGIQMDIVSTSANDDGSPAGTGVQTVVLYYLDNAGTPHTESLTLNGTGVVATVATNIARVNNLIATAIGSGGVAAGTITLSEHGGTTRIYSRIETGYTRARQCVYTVPTGYKLYLNSLNVSGVNTSVGHWCRFTLRATYDEFSGAVRDFFLPFAEILVVDQSFARQFITPLYFPAGVTIRVSAISDAASSNELCSCALRGWIETA